MNSRLGFCAASTDQLSSSTEASSRSRQSVMAFESRKSPKKPANCDTTEVTCRRMSMVDWSAPVNWEFGTVRHSVCKKSD